MIHLAGVGAVFRTVTSEEGFERKLAGPDGYASTEGPLVTKPARTLCGRVVQEGRDHVRVLLPLDSPHACPRCVAARPKKRERFQSFQPVMFKDEVALESAAE